MDLGPLIYSMTSIALHALPAELKMFIYEREQQAQPCVMDPEAWAVQDASSDDSDSQESEEGQTHATLPASSSSAICLVQITTGAAQCTARMKTCSPFFARHAAWAGICASTRLAGTRFHSCHNTNTHC